MRIGIDIRALLEGRTTGVQVYVANLLEALLAIDQKNEYVFFGNSFSTQQIPLQGRFSKAEWKMFNYPNKIFMPAQKYLQYPKVDQMLGGVDLFFSPHWRVTALDPKIPLVTTFHDLSFEVLPEFFTWRQRLWHSFMNYRQAATRATKIVAVSEHTKKDLIDLYQIPQEKIAVIYPGLAQTAKHTLKFKEYFHKQPPNNYFLYFGTFEPRKNVQGVIQAYQQYFLLSKFSRPLVLAGSRGWKLHLSIPSELKGHVTILQNLDEAEKTRLYTNAFAFLFLSFYEGFGFPVLEASSLGIPVISSYNTSLGEIAGNFALLVNPFRPSQVAKAMMKLEQDMLLYQKLSQQGLAASKEFTWDKSARQMIELFEQTVSQG